MMAEVGRVAGRAKEGRESGALSVGHRIQPSCPNHLYNEPPVRVRCACGLTLRWLHVACVKLLVLLLGARLSRVRFV